jgi:hypothetical protein
MRYVKKPIIIDAEKWTGNNLVDILNFCDKCYLKPTDGKEELTIATLEGPMRASINDYIIKGIQGEFYACKPDIFELTYDIVK